MPKQSKDRMYLSVACKSAREKYIKTLVNLGTLAAETPLPENIEACRDEVNWLDGDLREARELMAAANVMALAK